MKPELILSDIHFHDWSAFEGPRVNGVNSRLATTIDCVRKAAAHLHREGGNEIIITGDVFHVRGKLAPSVLNPVEDLFRELDADGFHVHVIPGNHDLEDNDSARVSNAVTVLEAAGARVYHETTVVGSRVFVPWFSSVAELIEELKKHVAPGRVAYIHAPIDGVLPHLPSHGLSDGALAELGYRFVFCGHYHNRKAFPNGVYSVGALTHQTWSDVGSGAGYLLFAGDVVRPFETSAPRFVHLNGDEDEDDIAVLVAHNYVRFSVPAGDASMDDVRKQLIEKYSAAGVIINQVRDKVVRRAVEVKSSTLIEAIASYVKANDISEAAHQQAVEIIGGLLSV